jgi:hypothetical protein
VVVEHALGEPSISAVGQWTQFMDAVEWRDEWLPAGDVVEVQSTEDVETWLRQRG